MSRVDTLLARFPGPVTLYPSRLKWFGYFTLSLAFAAAGLYLAIAGNLDSEETFEMWLCFVFSASARLRQS